MQKMVKCSKCGKQLKDNEVVLLLGTAMCDNCAEKTRQALNPAKIVIEGLVMALVFLVFSVAVITKLVGLW